MIVDMFNNQLPKSLSPKALNTLVSLASRARTNRLAVQMKCFEFVFITELSQTDSFMHFEMAYFAGERSSFVFYPSERGGGGEGKKDHLI